MYVDLTRVEDEDFEAALPQLEAASGIIFDLRGYPQVSIGTIGHLIDEPVKSPQMWVPLVTQPDQQNLEFEFSTWEVEPKAPRFEGRIAFLTDGQALSYAETYMSIIEHYQLAEIVGEPTGGTNGNVNQFSIPGKYTLYWTGMKVLKHDGSQHHGVGIQPTIFVSRTIQGIAEGRDEQIERAIEAVKQSPTSAVHTLGSTTVRAADGMTMVYVPDGEFRMGITGSLADHPHAVALDSFRIDQTEVANNHYRRCVEAGTCRAPTTCSWGEPTYEDAARADHPVICVTWQNANAYCRWARGRLPTEAEWEYVARGPDSAIYPWGDEFDGTRLNSCDVNCPHRDQRVTDYDDGYALTAPVGSYPSAVSWCGALDMAGNVWEWVADWHGPYPLTRQTNPTGPESGSERVVRGGSWFDYNEYGFLRADNRHPYEPRAADHLVGFRCVVPAGE